MSRVSTSVTDIPTIKTGIGGNVYAFSSNKNTLIKLCEQINKSTNSIYFSKKHNCYAIRIKAKHHKEKRSSAGNTSNVRDYVTVVLTEDIEQARQSRELLRNNDIPAVIKKSSGGDLGALSIAVMVPEDFLDEAHVLIESQEAYDDFYDIAFDDDENIESLDTNLADDYF